MNREIVWEKGKQFSIGGKKYYVADIDIDYHYQTNFTRTWVKYFKQVRGSYVPVWVDSMELEQCA